MELTTIIAIFVAGIITNNFALIEFLGTGAVIENERSSRKSLIIGLCTTLVMVLATLITWPINHFLLANATYLQPLVFVLVILVVVEAIHLITKKHVEGYCKVDFLKFAINGAVLGLCVHNTHLDFGQAALSSFAVGLGLTFTMIVFSSLEHKIDKEAVPASFRGLPIALLTAGMMALALLAFLK
jgi:electron transport complex protein RnfA